MRQRGGCIRQATINQRRIKQIQKRKTPEKPNLPYNHPPESPPTNIPKNCAHEQRPNALPLRASGAVLEINEGRKASSKEKPEKNNHNQMVINIIFLDAIHKRNSAMAKVMMLPKKYNFSWCLRSA